MLIKAMCPARANLCVPPCLGALSTGWQQRGLPQGLLPDTLWPGIHSSAISLRLLVLSFRLCVAVVGALLAHLGATCTSSPRFSSWRHCTAVVAGTCGRSSVAMFFAALALRANRAWSSRLLAQLRRSSDLVGYLHIVTKVLFLASLYGCGCWDMCANSGRSTVAMLDRMSLCAHQGYVPRAR